MLAILANRTYRHLFAAQVIALVGTGLATVALGLLAYDIAGADAGAVLGTALAIKMVAYIGIAPIVGAYADRLPRKGLLVGMDLVRAMIALLLPFVDAVWQVYILTFVLQSASAAFTPTFQATIPEILPDEVEYTKALSLSRLAYDLESLLSPILAAALLTVINFHWLFSGTSVGFAVSALLVCSAILPNRPTVIRVAEGAWRKTTRGVRLYLKTPRLVGLLAVTLAAASGSAMAIVNTVVIVKAAGGDQRDVALTLAAYGGGSMLAALALPRILTRHDDRAVMLTAAGIVAIVLVGLGLATSESAPVSDWPPILVGWPVLGAAYALCVTPGGRLLRRSSGGNDRPALFAAQFALSHVCWLAAYPIAGQFGAAYGMQYAFLSLGALAALGLVAGLFLWPRYDPDVIEHDHPDLPIDHPHMAQHRAEAHAHVFHIDDLHASWPRKQ